jgi:hypothetical protein
MSHHNGEGDVPDWPDSEDPEDLIGRQIVVRVRGRRMRPLKGQDDMYTGLGDHMLGDPRWASQFLEQGDVWQDATGAFLDIVDMEATHAQATITLLMRLAPQIVLAVALGETPVAEGVLEDDATEQVADPAKARAWLLTTTLVRALITRASFPTSGAAPWKRRTRRLVNRARAIEERLR